MAQVYLSLGSNMGDRLSFLNRTIEALAEHLALLGVSSVYESEPVGHFVEFKTPVWFLNQVIHAQVSLYPEQLLELTQGLEQRLGRTEKTRFPGMYSSRSMDIDLLIYDDLVLKTPVLELPHPRLVERKYVLVPLCEIAPYLLDPISRRSFSRLLKDCNDPAKVRLYEY